MTITVGEGQAYVVNTPTLSAQIETKDSAGFLGKPQLFADQTLSTGDVQQLVAISYTVEKGDSLISIADRYNISVGTIVDANSIKISDIEKIQPGTTLIIPSEDTNTSLAWLDGLNKLKADEKEKLRQQELQKQAARDKQLAQQKKSQSQASRTAVQLASAIGNISVLGTFRNLGVNGALPGQCTYWVKYKRPDLPAQMGNANQYMNSARSYGIPTGRTARVGAVIQTKESGYGHVGYVVGVGNGTVTFTEMNYFGPYIVDTRTINADSGLISGYVY